MKKISFILLIVLLFSIPTAWAQGGAKPVDFPALALTLQAPSGWQLYTDNNFYRLDNGTTILSLYRLAPANLDLPTGDLAAALKYEAEQFAVTADPSQITNTTVADRAIALLPYTYTNEQGGTYNGVLAALDLGDGTTAVGDVYPSQGLKLTEQDAGLAIFATVSVSAPTPEDAELSQTITLIDAGVTAKIPATWELYIGSGGYHEAESGATIIDTYRVVPDLAGIPAGDLVAALKVKADDFKITFDAAKVEKTTVDGKDLAVFLYSATPTSGNPYEGMLAAVVLDDKTIAVADAYPSYGVKALTEQKIALRIVASFAVAPATPADAPLSQTADLINIGLTAQIPEAWSVYTNSNHSQYLQSSVTSLDPYLVDPAKQGLAEGDLAAALEYYAKQSKIEFDRTKVKTSTVDGKDVAVYAYTYTPTTGAPYEVCIAAVDLKNGQIAIGDIYPRFATTLEEKDVALRILASFAVAK